MNAVVPPQHLHSATHDEIDLVQLVSALWKQKTLIIAVTILAGLIGLAYAMLTTRYYTVQSVLRPAAIKDLDELNHLGIYKLSPKQALAEVGAALDSYENRLGFFRDNQQLFADLAQPGRSLEQTFESFNDDAFELLQPDAKKAESTTPFIGIQLTYPQDLNGVQIVNGFVQYSLNNVRQQVAADLDTLIGNRLSQLEKNMAAARANYEASKEIKIAKLSEADALKRAELNDELAALRQQLKTRRDNRINQLNEAIRIATSLGISKPTTPSSLGAAEITGQGSVIRTEVNNQQIPLYFMGSNALEAERKALLARRSDDFTEPRIAQIARELKLLQHNRQIEVLNSRENEDLFLKDLATWREEAARLRALQFDTESLKLVSIDQAAVEPSRPIKPRKALIVALALVLGGMLGLFIALVRNLRRPVVTI
ncbi:chain-length determining protein [Pseudomonas sp. MTM4]|uniref:Wzz/FepE/Etk N-terminal domain-containing protein n=1 Tax=unclassified Pseudomonas TaxID=196821 RepID=UPI0018D21407|nr:MULTISPECIES: Wzz/FepE/Etk N-terminal domain-containing protein [unclassified Pseudomonas]MBC8651626.1 chain-length determining protein [Pseudomonas sp. MT4]QXY91347.1 chain-length determining protein [Pseudomonas sp. MTM4]